MRFDAALGFPELRPGVFRQAEADCGGVDQVDVAQLLFDVGKTVFAAEVGDQTLEQHLQNFRAQSSQPAGDRGCGDGVNVDFLAEIPVVQAARNFPQAQLPCQLGVCHEFDELQRVHLLDALVGFHLFESLVKLRKNRKELLEWSFWYPCT